MELKRYIEYKIIVTYLNGEDEIVAPQGADISSYKEMLRVYQDTKERLREESVYIKFIGIKDDGETKVFFEKQIVTEDLAIKEKAEKLQNCESFELIQRIIDDIEELNAKRAHVTNEVSICDKKENVLLHEIESSVHPTNPEKVKMFDELKNLREHRRNMKNEKVALDRYFDMVAGQKIILNHLRNISTTFIKHNMERRIEFNSKIVPLTKEKAEEFKIIKEIGYRSFRDRIKLMKKLQKSYDKVFHDDVKMKIICYNKSNCS